MPILKVVGENTDRLLGKAEQDISRTLQPELHMGTCSLTVTRKTMPFSGHFQKCFHPPRVYLSFLILYYEPSAIKWPLYLQRCRTWMLASAGSPSSSGRIRGRRLFQWWQSQHWRWQWLQLKCCILPKQRKHKKKLWMSADFEHAPINGCDFAEGHSEKNVSWCYRKGTLMNLVFP